MGPVVDVDLATGVGNAEFTFCCDWTQKSRKASSATPALFVRDSADWESGGGKDGVSVIFVVGGVQISIPRLHS